MKLKAWFAAARPHTLSASVVPVLVGTGMAMGKADIAWDRFWLTMAGAVLVQIGANLTDEYADHDATSSRHKYLAPHKVIARELLTAAAVRRGAAIAFGAATLIGLWLVWISGWQLLVLCLASVAVAYLYAGGPFPLGDYALGEVMVFIFMGPVIVLGTLFVQTSAFGWDALWLSLPVGALVTAILVANNLRDREEDMGNGRRTSVTLFGERPMRIGYVVLIAASFALPFSAIMLGWGAPPLVLPWLTIPLAAKVVGWLLSASGREGYHRALKGTSALHLSFGLLLALGMGIGGV